MRTKLVAAGAAAGLAVGLALLWQPTAGLRVRALANRAEAAIAGGDVLVSPAELATLMYNQQIDLAIFDLRDESAYNQFHLADARRATSTAALHALPEQTVKILVDGSAEAAFARYRELVRAGVKQVYVLAGGIPAWLALFAPPQSSGGLLAGALGGRHPASYPDLEHVALPKFEPKVKLGGGGAKKSAGCGG